MVYVVCIISIYNMSGGVVSDIQARTLVIVCLMHYRRSYSKVLFEKNTCKHSRSSKMVKIPTILEEKIFQKSMKSLRKSVVVSFDITRVVVSSLR